MELSLGGIIGLTTTSNLPSKNRQLVKTKFFMSNSVRFVRSLNEHRLYDGLASPSMLHSIRRTRKSVVLSRETELTDSRAEPDSLSEDATDAFVSLLVQHRHSLYAFIAKQLVNPADAEDVFQKTSLVLWKKMEQFDRDASFFHWACGIAFNEVRNFLTVQRRGKLHFDVDLIQLLAQEAAEEKELTDSRLSALRECLSKLPARQQQILRRCYMGTDSISDVADGLRRQRTAIYKQLARLKEKLRACIQQRMVAVGARS